MLRDDARRAPHLREGLELLRYLCAPSPQYHPEPVVHEVYVDPRGRETHPITTGSGINGAGAPGPQWIGPAANLAGVGKKAKEPLEKEREREKEKERVVPSIKRKGMELMGIDNKKIPDWQLEQVRDDDILCSSPLPFDSSCLVLMVL